MQVKTRLGSGVIIVEIDPYSTEPVDFYPRINVYKTWRMDKKTPVWMASSITITSGDFLIEQSGVVIEAIGRAIAEAMRIDKENPPGSPAVEHPKE